MLKTAVAVPAIRRAVLDWQTTGYAGVTETTRMLLNFWFNTDHRLPNGARFAYHKAQQEAIETLIYVYEVAKIRSRTALLEKYAPAHADIRLPGYDEFARYATKMATGSGKTKVMSLAIVWQYLNAVREDPDDYATNFLILAPNVIVYERLAEDFAGGRIFHTDPTMPKAVRDWQWNMSYMLRGDPAPPPADGLLILTNIQQLYTKPDKKGKAETDIMTDVLGAAPKPDTDGGADIGDVLAGRGGKLLVLNDEAHHTHDEESEWNQTIRRLHAVRPLAAQLDYSATPRFTKGSLFPWVISDYPIKQALVDSKEAFKEGRYADCVIKQPVKGIANFEEAKSDHASIRYQGYLTAAVERWREYRDRLKEVGRNPLLFIMMNSTEEADDVYHWLIDNYKEDFAGEDKTLVIHTNKSGEITNEKELDRARKLAREVDKPGCPTNAIVSVLMLREGWDVSNVTVVVGLRPYSASANILPEQAIGRGLRLMFRGQSVGYEERVDIIGNKAFLSFVDDLEKTEDLKLETFEVGKDKLKIVTIAPDPAKTAQDIEMPRLTPVLVRKKTLADEINALDVRKFAFSPDPLPRKPSDSDVKKFQYQGYDILTLEKLIDTEYVIPDVQQPEQVVGYYARLIASTLKLPSQFSNLAPKIWQFFEERVRSKG